MGIPLAVWASRVYLERFAYRVEGYGWVFVADALISLAIAFASVLWQTLRAARTIREQAMLESFQAVPGRSHLPGALPTEELARDWRLRELERDMQKAAETYACAEQAAQEMLLQDPDAADAQEEARRRRDEAQAAWTESCLQWYEEFRSFHLH